MKRELDLTGKTALVTGGGTGIGRGIAGELRDCGARVVIAGRREEPLREAAGVLGVEWVSLDIADHAGVPGAVAAIEERFGAVEILVNNAGVQNNNTALAFDADELRAMFEINIIGTYTVTKEVAGRMVERGRGSIVFISSGAAYMALPKNLPYSASKGGVSAMSRAFASELSPQGVRVNAVCPGWIETELVKESMRRIPERREMALRRSMLGRFGTPEEIGMAVAFLASDAASYITGAELRVDGGTSVSL